MTQNSQSNSLLLQFEIMSLRLQFDAELEEAKNAAYSEGRKDEREASCVDELVAALKDALSIFGPDAGEEPKAPYWDARVRALLTKLEQS